MGTYDSAIKNLINRLQQPAAQGTFVFVGIYTFVWGLWTIIFTSFASSKLYSWLNDIASSRTFGLIAIICGAAMVATVLRDKYPFTAYGAFLGSLFWGLVGTGYLFGDYHSTGSVTAFGLSIYSAFVYFNLRFDRSNR